MNRLSSTYSPISPFLSPVWHADAFPYIIASVSKCVMRPGFSYSQRGLLNVIIAKACHRPVMYCRLALLAAWWFSGGVDGLVPAASSWAGLGWAGPDWAELCSLAVCRINTRPPHAHCSIEGDILYLCHTHNLMNMVISELLLSFSENCLIHLVQLLLFMQTRCSQQRRIIGGSNVFALWRCYSFECENITAFVASWKGEVQRGCTGCICYHSITRFDVSRSIHIVYTHRFRGRTVKCFITEYETHSI